MEYDSDKDEFYQHNTRWYPNFSGTGAAIYTAVVVA
jgi:hypothetical protein